MKDKFKLGIDKLIQGINPDNPLLREAREILHFVRESEHNQSSTYTSAIYLFLGRDPVSAVNALKLGVAENRRSYGPGLLNEMPPNLRTHNLLLELEKRKHLVGEMIRDSYSRLRNCFNFSVEEGMQEQLESLRYHLFRSFLLEEALAQDIPYQQSRDFADFFIDSRKIISKIIESEK